MLDKFTARARKAILLAREEASRLNHEYVGTEHVLLGLIREGEGVAATVLRKLGLTLESVRKEVERVIPPGAGSQPYGDIPFTARAKKVLELAIAETEALGHNYVGTEHLLLGLIREQEGMSAKILLALDISPERIRQETLILLGGSTERTHAGAATTCKSKSSTPTLDEFSRDLTALAREGKLDPVIGREQEIQRVVQVLSRRKKNNPVLLGEPGVGKTAIVEGLAQRIVAGQVAESLCNKRLLTLDLAGVVAGTKYRGQFEERLKFIIEEMLKQKDVILFIDELHTLIGAGAAEGAIDASNMLKPALARGELQCIGATTLAEYRKHIEKDGALERRFQTIIVDPPSTEEAILILMGLRKQYEDHHHVTITDEAIRLAVRLSDRYISDRFLPDKAIDVIDEGSAMVRLRAGSASDEFKVLGENIEKHHKAKEEAISRQDYETAAHFRDLEWQARQALKDAQEGRRENNEGYSLVLTEEDVAEVVSRWTGIPVNRLEEAENSRLLRMEKELHKRVIGQEEAINIVSRAIRRSRTGMADDRRPIGSFLFLGPTGVGKTELARSLAEFLFDDERTLIRIDMSEYMEKFAVSRLIGAPPGYVGYEEGGQLTEKVRRKPYSVVLLDEIEKAHPDVFNLLLQVLEDGRLTDSFGRTVNFRNTILIMTSNIGARQIRDGGRGMGFQTSTEDANYQSMKNLVLGEVKQIFNPEFLNRLDEVIVFHTLTLEELRKIVGIMLERVRTRLAEHMLHFSVEDSAIEFIIRTGYDEKYGARPLRRTIQKYIEDPLADMVISGEAKTGDIYMIQAQGDDLVFIKQNQPAAVGGDDDTSNGAQGAN